VGRRRRVVWTEPASSHLSGALEFFARHSPAAVDRFLRAVEIATLSLDVLADRGRLVPELPGTGIREIFVRRFRLMYLVDEEVVLIVALIHGAREL
jgi:toxin ParE1/3/4